ncbi:hypothetical protein [Roseibacillus persicicus]|uniref:hypothetical protein n=1 Tax=Roseibacillus persicicus TaxID=454148 RepID=UPI002810188F|nr:hypothetical protein [Roseibacillus persicicus]MDQ8190227.1 hypothetical protein [Roseibacillus persicicus]
MTKEGQLIEVGSDLLISGSLSNSLIQETVVTPLTQYQDSLNSHIRKHTTAASKESLEPRPAPWSQLPELPGCWSEDVFFRLQNDPDNTFGTIEDSWKDVLNNPAALTRTETFTKSQIIFKSSQVSNLEESLPSAHLGKPFVCMPITSPQDLRKGEPLLTAIIDGFSVGHTLPRHYQGRLLLSDPFNSISDVISKAQRHFIRLLWLHDGECSLPLVQPSTKGPSFGAAALRGETARAFARRINFHSQDPHLVALDFATPQSDWVAFLKTQEHLLPGISGSCKNLLATLFYSIVEIAKNNPGILDSKALSAGVRDLAKYIIRRAAFERVRIPRNDQIAKEEGLKTRILTLLQTTPKGERSLYRSLAISASDCRRLLLELETEELICRDDSSDRWLLFSPEHRQSALPTS